MKIFQDNEDNHKLIQFMTNWPELIKIIKEILYEEERGERGGRGTQRDTDRHREMQRETRQRQKPNHESTRINMFNKVLGPRKKNNNKNQQTKL